MSLLSEDITIGAREDHNQSYTILTGATVVLLATAILGPILTGIRVASFHLFWFRLYLPIYVVYCAWFLWSNQIVSVEIPTAMWLFAGFVGYMALSAVWTIDTGETIRKLAIIGSLLFVGGAVFFTSFTEDTLSKYILVIFSLVALAELITVIEIFTGFHLHTSSLIPDPIDEVRVGVDVGSAWYFNRNNLSFFLALACGPLLAYSLDAKRWLVRILPLAGIAVALFTMWAGGAWSGIVTIFVAVLAVSVFYVLRSRVPLWKSTRRQLAIVTAFMFAATAISVIVIATIPNPFPVNSSFWERWQLSLAAVEMFFNSNGVGVGVGSFLAAVDALPIDTNSKLAPHNWLLYMLGAFGVVGTVLFLAGYARLFYDLGVRTLNNGTTLQLGLFGALFAFPVGALGPSNALLTRTFWVFLGLAAAAAYQIPDSIDLKK